MRQPLRLTSTLRLISRSAVKTPIRSFHQAPRPNFFTSRTSKPSTVLTKARDAFRQSRSYSSPVAAAENNSLATKLIVAAAAVGGTVVITNMIFNRETREDGGMPPFERAYLNDTFMHTGLGIGIIGISARAMFQSGFIYRMMATNPWVVMIGGMALSIGTMMGTRATDPSK